MTNGQMEPAAAAEPETEPVPVQRRYQDRNRDAHLLETRLNLVKFLENGGHLRLVRCSSVLSFEFFEDQNFDLFIRSSPMTS